MKKWVSILLMGAMTLSLAACGGKKEETPAATESAKETQVTETVKETADEVIEEAEKLDRKIKVGYDIYWLGNSWSVQQYQEFKWNAENNFADQIEVTYVESDNDVSKQIANLEDLIAQGVDVIITTPIDATSINSTLEDAQEEGIKVILLAATVEGDCYDSMVNVDEMDFGATGAQWLVDQLEGKGKIIMLNGISGFTSNEMRKQGAHEVFEKYPDIEIIAEQDAKWDYATAKTVVADLLATYPEIDGVWSQGGAMTLGAIEAFQAANRELVPMTGEDNNGYVKKVVENNMEGIAVAKPTWLTRVAIENAINLMNGVEVKKDDMYPVMTIKTEEMKKYVHPDLSDDVWCGTEMPEEVLAEIFKN